MSGNQSSGSAADAHIAAEAKSDTAHGDLADTAKAFVRGEASQTDYDTARDNAAGATQDVHQTNSQLPYSQG
ncbi:hypothetical protein [Actinomadura citrea]|uniref:Uncharacterized protein n=1 Tax=Actinomadura citrea TaxID=46158 RepID=A0A7Y9GJQ2_9ACTN|nr:hypothetical protein [Actinomadura citrea]NYE16610.1 hypothetical protein [Actinomadura citrea]GGT56839.1 hypothetical protein GCM10010177_11180 [Actinomadura citrea]